MGGVGLPASLAQRGLVDVAPREARRGDLGEIERGRPVDIVIPSYRDAERVRKLVKSIAKTVPRGMARVIVADDSSGPEHLAALRRISGIER